MDDLDLQRDSYTTTSRKCSFLATTFPSAHFYLRFIRTVLRSGARAARGDYDDARWRQDSYDILRYLEDIGLLIHVSGLNNLQNANKPCVIIGNHMSFLETLLLPVLILPTPVTFVVKQSLLEYPVFKHVMRSRNPVAVSRTNPRQDLKTVLEEGQKRLAEGISVVVFPQSTRSHTFDPKQMGSIGVKLAKKANVPVVPLALKTDALQNGSMLKDFGKIRRDIPVHFSFGRSLMVEGRGNEEQGRINGYIEQQIVGWSEQQVTKGRSCQ